MTNALDFVFEESRPPAPVADHVTDELLRQRAVAIRGSARSLPRLADAPELEYLWISGVDPRAAETVAQLSRLHRLVIHDYRLRDLKPIDSLVNLESLMICGRSFIRSLAGLESLMRLKRLLLFQLTDYRTIEPVAALGEVAHEWRTQGRGFRRRSLSDVSLRTRSGRDSQASGGDASDCRRSRCTRMCCDGPPSRSHSGGDSPIRSCTSS